MAFFRQEAESVGVRASGLLEECFRLSLYRRREGIREDEDVRDRYFKRTSGVLDALEELHTRRCDRDPSQSAAGLSVIAMRSDLNVMGKGSAPRSCRCDNGVEPFLDMLYGTLYSPGGSHLEAGSRGGMDTFCGTAWV